MFDGCWFTWACAHASPSAAGVTELRKNRSRRRFVSAGLRPGQTHPFGPRVTPRLATGAPRSAKRCPPEPERARPAEKRLILRGAHSRDTARSLGPPERTPRPHYESVGFLVGEPVAGPGALASGWGVLTLARG